MKREGSVPRTPYYRSGFLNVPLDRDYYPLLYAIVFAIYDCGYVARCALDTDASTQVRIAKLYDLIFRSKYGIHDISRTQLDKRNRLPRFNMPLELGIFLGAKAYGTARHPQSETSAGRSWPRRIRPTVHRVRPRTGSGHTSQRPECLPYAPPKPY